MQRRVLDQSVSVDGCGSAVLAADGVQVTCLTYLANGTVCLVGVQLHDGVPKSELLPRARRALQKLIGMLALLDCCSMAGRSFRACQCVLRRKGAILLHMFTAHVIFRLSSSFYIARFFLIFDKIISQFGDWMSWHAM